MFETIKKGILAVNKLADAMVQYADAISEHADAVANRIREKNEGKPVEQKTATKNRKSAYFKVVCLETGEMITSREKYALYRKIKIGLGGASTRALKQGKTVKSAKTQLHYKAVKGFE